MMKMSAARGGHNEVDDMDGGMRKMIIMIKMMTTMMPGLTIMSVIVAMMM